MPPDPLAAHEPPQDLEAERAVLGSILLHNPAAGDVLEIIEPASFYHPGHRILFEICIKLYDARRPIDARVLHNELVNAGTLEAVGGPDYIASLMEAVPSAANAEHYAEIVREKFVRRELIRTCYEILKDAAQGGEDPKDLLDRAEHRIFDIVKHRTRAPSIKIADILREAFNFITEIRGGQRRATGLESGFFQLDDLTTGFQPEQLIIVAGRPGTGKSSFAQNIALHLGVEKGVPVLFFSLEMDAPSIARGMLCSLARFDGQKLRKGIISEEDYGNLMVKAGKFSEAPIFIDDTAGLSILELRARARRMTAEHGIKLIIVDYLQLMDTARFNSRRSDNRQEEVAMISRNLKILARELGIPVMALSQLNRSVEKEERKPRLSDLRESGALEQDADIVLLLYREVLHNPDCADDKKNSAELIIAKQRSGPTDTVPLVFLREFTLFANPTLQQQR